MSSGCAISNTFRKETQWDAATRWLPRKEKEALHEKFEKVTTAAFKQIASTLTPEQLESSRKLVFRQMAGIDINSQPAEFLDFIGITPEQKRTLQKLRREMDSRLQRQAGKIADRTLAMLTPQQLRKVRTKVEEFYRADHEPTIEKVAKGDSGPVLMFDLFVAKLDAESDNNVTQALPFYDDLSQGAVRKALGLSVDQRKQLQKIADGYRTKMEGPATDREITVKTARLAAEVRQQIESLLTPEQLTTLKEIVFRGALPTRWPIPKSKRRYTSAASRRRRSTASSRTRTK